MKSILISTRPNWCEKICHKIGEKSDGTPIYEKSVEVRKTAPKCKTPFKVLIYCTMNGDSLQSVNSIVQKPNKTVIDLTKDTVIYDLNGKVIGEFVCDEMYFWNCDIHDYDSIALEALSELSCVSEDDLLKYADRGNLYGWHISDLVIYDKPRELSEFANGSSRLTFDDSGKMVLSGMKRPPQSWCYVEEVQV